jgi:bifunctional DNA-binding transcriptional regulator/antitoxin component of YhaV-PrlF toxin-antitoxin module
MAYQSTVQVIERANDTRQFYLICPAPLARALEMEKGETIEWVVEDKYTLVIKRARPAPSARRREVQHER